MKGNSCKTKEAVNLSKAGGELRCYLILQLIIMIPWKTLQNIGWNKQYSWMYNKA